MGSNPTVSAPIVGPAPFQRPRSRIKNPGFVPELMTLPAHIAQNPPAFQRPASTGMIYRGKPSTIRRSARARMLGGVPIFEQPGPIKLCGAPVDFRVRFNAFRQRRRIGKLHLHGGDCRHREIDAIERGRDQCQCTCYVLPRARVSGPNRSSYGTRLACLCDTPSKPWTFKSISMKTQCSARLFQENIERFAPFHRKSRYNVRGWASACCSSENQRTCS